MADSLESGKSLTTSSAANAGSGASEIVASLKDNPIYRHLAVMLGIAASVALGVAVVLWSQTPSMAPLYANLAEKDVAQVMEVLNQAGAEFRVDQATGIIMVPNGMVKELRMKLAAEGLPHSDGLGFELMQEELGFGTSRLVENARHLQAMQGELARTITTLGPVQSVRVHLAIPKQSVFVRERKQPSASVTLKLYPGRSLEPRQVDAIVHLVASAVPELEAGRVTVVDQKGRLLSDRKSSEAMERSTDQFEFTQKIEDNYRERIENLLTPIVGMDKVRAQVTAEIDFSLTEQTQERYNPDQPALRSEQLNEERRTNGDAQGVPGALSNQPPAAGTAPEVAGGEGEAPGDVLSSSSQATRNYELDRVISHTRNAPTALRRLSVAVVVDDAFLPGAEGQPPVRRERTPEEMQRLTQLVREAIGFDARRGDSVSVINSAFMAPTEFAELPEPPMWEQTWFWDLLKQVGGLALVLLLIFGVLRPTMKRLTATHAELEGEQGALAGAAAGGAAGDGSGASVTGPLGPDGEPLQGLNGDPMHLGQGTKTIKLPGGGEYENIMDAARNLVDEDPKRVAQLVKLWVIEDGR